MDTKSNIIELFRLLRNRPAMLMKGDVGLYLNYVVFFEGFFLSRKLFNEIDIERKISSWYQDKVKFKAPNMYWFDQFELIHKDKTEKEKIDQLLACLQSFFEENF